LKKVSGKPSQRELKVNSYILSREYPDRPIVGVGAVIVNNGRVLLVQRGTEPFKGQWSLPGGVQDVGETLQEGIVREVREETGLDVEPVEVAGVIDRILPDATGKLQYHYVLIDYVCRVIGGELLPASDAEDVRWVREDELNDFQLVIGTEEVVRKVLLKYKS
jgi:mutator protein MutT